MQGERTGRTAIVSYEAIGSRRRRTVLVFLLLIAFLAVLASCIGIWHNAITTEASNRSAAFAAASFRLPRDSTVLSFNSSTASQGALKKLDIRNDQRSEIKDLDLLARIPPHIPGIELPPGLIHLSGTAIPVQGQELWLIFVSSVAANDETVTIRLGANTIFPHRKDQVDLSVLYGDRLVIKLMHNDHFRLFAGQPSQTGRFLFKYRLNDKGGTVEVSRDPSSRLRFSTEPSCQQLSVISSPSP